jgi:hypothetical protein
MDNSIYDMLYVIARAIQHDIAGTEMIWKREGKEIDWLPEDKIRINNLVDELLVKLNNTPKRYKGEV